jgi:hypothetical protein
MTEYHKVGDETIILESKIPSDGTQRCVFTFVSSSEMSFHPFFLRISGHESRTLLTSAVTVRDVLTSGFSIVQIVITFIVTFLLNFLVVYYGEGGSFAVSLLDLLLSSFFSIFRSGQRLVMVGIASPSGGILTSSALSPIFQVRIKLYFFLLLHRWSVLMYDFE